MPTPKLPIGSGLHRARRNRSRGPRRTSDVICSECGQLLAQVADCTCLSTAKRGTALPLRPIPGACQLPPASNTLKVGQPFTSRPTP